MTSLESTIRKELLESFNIAKLEQLIRLGFLPMHRLPLLRRALNKLQTGYMLNPEERSAISMLMDKLMGLTMSDNVIFQRLRSSITSNRKNTMEDNIKEGDELLRRTPEGMLDTITSNIRTKLAAGGKVSPEEKRLSSRAKAELRRRRDVKKKRRMRESYEHALQTVLNNYNVNTISDLPSDEVKEFFSQVESIYNSGE